MKYNKKSMNSIFKNKYFLYFIFIIAFFNLLGYLGSKNYKAIVCFGLITFLTTFITKNMAIVLSVAIIATIIITPFLSLVKEGMDNIKTDDKDKNKKNKESIENKDTSSNINTYVQENEQENEVENVESLDTLNKGINGGSKKTNNYVDLASTLEESYDNLNNMLGSGGINKLTDDTKKLMDQQGKLYKNMEAMTPLVSSAKKMLESFDMNQFNDIIKSASSFGINVNQKPKTA
jgi:uncharacterized membrane protein YciS (DUF1049 family)